MDRFYQGYHRAGRKRVLPTAHAWDRDAGFGQRGNSPRCSLALRNSGEKWGVVVMKPGVLARYSACDRRCYVCICQLAACTVLIFSIVCWLEPEVGVAPGQPGLLLWPLPAVLSQDCSTLMSFYRSTPPGVALRWYQKWFCVDRYESLIGGCRIGHRLSARFALLKPKAWKWEWRFHGDGYYQAVTI